MYSKHQWILNIAYLIGALFIGSFIVFYLIFKFNKIDYICQKLTDFSKKLPHVISEKLIVIIQKINTHTNSFVEGFEVLNSIKYTSQAFLMSIIIWLMNAT